MTAIAGSSQSRAVLCLTTAGIVGADVLEAAEQVIAERLDLEVWRRPALVEPADAWDPVRGQYSSLSLMRQAVAAAPRQATRMLVLTEVDIFVPVLSFVFGHAQLDGPIAIMATARLRQSFYGLPADDALELRRVRIETLHELGHTLGLTHCPEGSCAMSLATTVQHVDQKDDEYCDGCSALAASAVARLRAPRRRSAAAGGST